MDATHDAVSRLLDWSAQGVDRAFGAGSEVEIKPARTFIAWRSELRLHRAERVDFATSARTEILLPALTRRLSGLRLLFVGSTPQSDLTYRPLDSAPDAIGKQSAGLRVAFGRSSRWSIDLQGGLLGQWPLGYYGRLRARRSRPFPFESVGRAAASVFWQTNTGWGTRQDLSLDRLFGEQVLARLSGTGTITEATHPWTWAGEASLLWTLDRSMSIVLAGGPSGTVKTGLPGADLAGAHLPAPRGAAALDLPGGRAARRVAARGGPTHRRGGAGRPGGGPVRHRHLRRGRGAGQGALRPGAGLPAGAGGHGLGAGLPTSTFRATLGARNEGTTAWETGSASPSTPAAATPRGSTPSSTP